MRRGTVKMSEQNKTQNSLKFDPWSPQPPTNPILLPTMPDPRTNIKSSEDYIASLGKKRPHQYIE